MKISYIIPMYNAEKSISACLEAIKDQSFQGEREVIIVDNNSTDDSKKIATTFGFPIYSEPQQGRSWARNRGLSLAKGEFIIFVDADTILDRKWTEECMHLMKYPWIDVIQGTIVPSGDMTKFITRFRKFYVAYRTNGTFNHLLHGDQAPLITTAAIWIKRSAIVKHNLTFDTSLERGEDTDFGYQIFFSGGHFAASEKVIAFVKDERNFFQLLCRAFENGIATKKIELKWRHSKSPRFPNDEIPLSFSSEQILNWSNLMKNAVEKLGYWFYPRKAYMGKTSMIKYNLLNSFIWNFHTLEKLALSGYIRVIWRLDKLYLYNLAQGTKLVLTEKLKEAFLTSIPQNDLIRVLKDNLYLSQETGDEPKLDHKSGPHF